MLIDTYTAGSLLVDNSYRAVTAVEQYELNNDSVLRANLFEIQHNINRVLEWLDNGKPEG